MPSTTSQLFDFFDEQQSFELERHEIASAAFGDLRYNVRSIIVSLAQSDDHDASEISRRLRAILSEWLTVPVPFDDVILSALTEMGEPEEVEARWGRDIRGHYEDACYSAQELLAVENPVRAKLADLIRKMRANGRTFRIFCHRWAQGHFESLQSEYDCPPLEAAAFVHSVAQYRELEPFNCLLKMGPLRSRGWGAAPDALITAPRFDTLIQVVWSGCGNEPGFGYDPASVPPPDGGSAGADNEGSDRSSSGTMFNWNVQQTRSRDSTVGRRGNVPDIDEFKIFTQLTKFSETQAATLVQVDEGHGILYPPHSRVLGLDPETGDSKYRLLGETLVEGMFLVIPVIDDTRLAGLQAEDGRLSPIWKRKLASEYSRDPAGLIVRLRDAGIRLSNLQSCIERWKSSATTVIHAPQMIQHFEILIKVLGTDFDPGEQRHTQRAAWWQYAWDEVRRARGEAIQSGVQEQHIVDEELLSVLHILNAEMKAHLDRPAFVLPIPDTTTVAGVFRFHRVVIVEEGFRAPRNELHVLCELERIDQWRV